MWPWRDRGVAIAALKPDNARQVASIHSEGFARGWGTAEVEALLADRTCLGHGAVSQGWPGTLDGFVLSRMAGDEAEILSIAVRRARHGRGIAGQLLAHHLGALAGAGMAALFLEVDENNAPALALYRRQGFQAVGQRKSYYRRADGSTANAVVMRRSLA
ncbi:MAG: GNAT family N-acetyltransferase [Beijerinckiaceae bacterium]